MRVPEAATQVADTPEKEPDNESTSRVAPALSRPAPILMVTLSALVPLLLLSVAPEKAATAAAVDDSA